MGEGAPKGADDLPDWEQELVDAALADAVDHDAGHERARKRALQLAREQAYFRLALEIDRPRRKTVGPGQLSFFPADPTLFDDPA